MTGRIKRIIPLLLAIAGPALAQDPRGPLYYNQPFVDGGASKSDVVRYVAGALAAGGTLPSQAGNNGKTLVTDGSTASWATPSGNATTVNGNAVPNSASVVGTDASGHIVTISTTGTGNNVFATSPTLTTPNLGQPTSLDLLNATNLQFAALPTLGANQILGNFSGGGAVGAVNAVLVPSATIGGVLSATGTNALSWSATLTAGQLVVGTGTGAPAPIGFLWQPSSSNTSIAFGTGAGQLCTSCTNLAAIGPNAMANATGNSNVGLGFNAGANISTGTNNLAIGSSALTGSAGTPTTGSSNTCIGFNACTNSIGAASNNTAIGQSSLSQNTTGTFNTCIGNAVCSAGVGTTSNIVVIGTNNSCIPTSTSTTNEIDLCAQSSASMRITGTNAPTTSKALFFGTVQAQGVGSNGTTFTLGTGTGACATSSTLTGGASGGSFLCTGTAGASTIIINLPTAPNGNGWICTGSDITSGVAFTQVTPTATTSCKLTGTVATTSDKVGFLAFSY